jgi:hypothetical protein
VQGVGAAVIGVAPPLDEAAALEPVDDPHHQRPVHAQLLGEPLLRHRAGLCERREDGEVTRVAALGHLGGGGAVHVVEREPQEVSRVVDKVIASHRHREVSHLVDPAMINHQSLDDQ